MKMKKRKYHNRRIQFDEVEEDNPLDMIVKGFAALMVISFIVYGMTL